VESFREKVAEAQETGRTVEEVLASSSSRESSERASKSSGSSRQAPRAQPSPVNSEGTWVTWKVLILSISLIASPVVYLFARHFEKERKKAQYFADHPEVRLPRPAARARHEPSASRALSPLAQELKKLEEKRERDELKEKKKAQKNKKRK
jgi:hypothetical protein